MVADRAMVDALVEQASVDLGGCLIGEARRMQKVQHGFDVRRHPRARRGCGRGRGYGQWPRQMPALAIDAGTRTGSEPHTHWR